MVGLRQQLGWFFARLRGERKLTIVPGSVEKRTGESVQIVKVELHLTNTGTRPVRPTVIGARGGMADGQQVGLISRWDPQNPGDPEIAPHQTSTKTAEIGLRTADSVNVLELDVALHDALSGGRPHRSHLTLRLT